MSQRVQLGRFDFVHGNGDIPDGFVSRATLARTMVGPANNAELAVHLLQRGERNREPLGGFRLPYSKEQSD